MNARFSLGKVSAEIIEYASQGSAVLGIRDSGKSYTATGIAEHMMDAGIPFTALDPVGIWRFLRVPGAGAHAKGYPVVVAGGEAPDLPLSPDTVQDLVRAAMRERVSLVIDLYSMDLSKADWRRIVAIAVRTMLYENKLYGLRHIFIEEAAEFVPQVIPRDGVSGQVYAEIEKLARMGGNAMLGYTLINQRAEQINKAVLELCANMLLHRQTGKNSIDSLAKWLKVSGAGVGHELTSSLPTLAAGECWAWISGSTTPVRTKVPAKRSFHPDRRALHGTGATAPGAAVNVAGFVDHMRAQLPVIAAEAAANDPARLKAQIVELQKLLDQRRAEAFDMEAVATARAEGYGQGRFDAFSKAATSLHQAGDDIAARLRAVTKGWNDVTITAAQAERLAPVAPAPIAREPAPAPAPRPPRATAAPGGLNAAGVKLLVPLLRNRGRSYRWEQVATLAGMVSGNGYFYGGRKALIDGGFVVEADGVVCAVQPVPPPYDTLNGPSALGRITPGEIVDTWSRKLRSPAPDMLAYLFAHAGRTIAVDDLARAIGKKPGNGYWYGGVAALREAGLVEQPAGGGIRVTELLRDG